MDGRGGCLIARYEDVSKVDRIMLRFPPIAPKPPASGSGSGSSPESSEATTRIGGRGRRRCYTRKRKAPGSGNRRDEEKKAAVAVTLPLLPENPDQRSSPASGPLAQNFAVKASNRTSWLSFGGYVCNYHDNNNFGESGNRQAEATRVVVESCVTVESVKNTWRYAGGASVSLGRSDDERRINLDRDRCPGFTSDSFGRVTWTNDAYREMVCGAAVGMVVVWLVTREPAPGAAAAFTCRVKVEYGTVTCGKESAPRRAVTVPCDVWRMDGGGFAWRLDVDAALRLGR